MTRRFSEQHYGRDGEFQVNPLWFLVQPNGSFAMGGFFICLDEEDEPLMNGFVIQARIDQWMSDYFVRFIQRDIRDDIDAGHVVRRCYDALN